MDKLHTEEEKLSLLKQYMTSGQSMASFAAKHGFTRPTLKNWLRHYGFPDQTDIEDELNSLGMPSDIDKLREELAALRKEKKRLERELEKEKIRSLAYNTLIDLAESTYHIKVRKNSDAK